MAATIKALEAAAQYQLTSAYAARPDFEPFTACAAKARTETLSELELVDLATPAYRFDLYS
jgi:hypothetical protein